MYKGPGKAEKYITVLNCQLNHFIITVMTLFLDVCTSEYYYMKVQRSQ